MSADTDNWHRSNPPKSHADHVYRVSFWKRSDDGRYSTSSDAEEADAIEIIGAGQYPSIKLEWPSEAYKASQITTFLNQATEAGKRLGKAEIRRALGI